MCTAVQMEATKILSPTSLPPQTHIQTHKAHADGEREERSGEEHVLLRD